jgi:hypothetical protein
MDPTKLVFDFNPAAQYPPAPSGLGGQVDLAKPNNFPSIIGTGVTAAVGFMNPCGLNGTVRGQQITPTPVAANTHRLQGCFRARL